MRHALIQWVPQAVFPDLPSEATRIDVEVRKGQYGYQAANKKVFRLSFFRQDGSLIPIEDKGEQVTFKDYPEDLIVGRRLAFYDPNRDTEYQGKVMGVDFRLVYYNIR